MLRSIAWHQGGTPVTQRSITEAYRRVGMNSRSIAKRHRDTLPGLRNMPPSRKGTTPTLPEITTAINAGDNVAYRCAATPLYQGEPV